MAPSVLSFTFLLLLLSILHPSPAPTVTSSPTPPSNSSLLPPSSLLSLLLVDQSRYLSSLVSPAHPPFIPIASGTNLLQSPTYVIRSHLGTPPQPLLLSLDTSSDTSWFTPRSFSPKLSSSFKPLPCSSPQCKLLPQHHPCTRTSPVCSFNFTYGALSLTAALAQDTLSLSSLPIKSYTFATVTNSAGASPPGLLGLGRGPLSFLSQTKNLYSSTFSYCLPHFRSTNFSGTLLLGPAGQPPLLHSTPLLSNPHRPSLYYVNLLKIRVGRKYVSIPGRALAFNPVTGAGTIFDSGTMFTRLVTPVYEAVRNEFRRRVGVYRNVTSLGGFDTCYHGAIRAPTVAFEFAGMNMTLPVENVVIRSSSGDLSCLAMAAAPENVNSVVNVIANMQQQNHRVLFDGVRGRVAVAREICTRA